MKTIGRGQRLIEIDIIRCLVIVVLVAFHAFAPFAGGWENPLPTNAQDNTLYYWFAKFLYSGMLETFVFISGYVYALGDSKHNYEVKTLIIAKIKRLYVPCLFWGCVCVLVYRGFYALFSLDTAISIVNGFGHLWFLPMLFWCFIFEKLIRKYITFVRIWILFIVAILPWPSLPLGIGNTFYYFLFFHLGYLCFLHRTEIFKAFQTQKKYLGFWVLAYLICFYVGRYMVEYTQLTPDMNLYTKILVSPLNKLSRLFYSVIAVYLYFMIGYILSNNITDQWLKVFNRISLASFGIYIFQEPILRVLYYKTTFCQIMTSSFYSWAAFLIALVFSYILVASFRRVPVLNKLF